MPKPESVSPIQKEGKSRLDIIDDETGQIIDEMKRSMGKEKKKRRNKEIFCMVMDLELEKKILLTNNDLDLFKLVSEMLCPHSKDTKTSELMTSFLARTNAGMKVGDKLTFMDFHKISQATFYYIRMRLMNSGLITRRKGVYYISREFSEYLHNIATKWESLV